MIAEETVFAHSAMTRMRRMVNVQRIEWRPLQCKYYGLVKHDDPCACLGYWLPEASRFTALGPQDKNTSIIIHFS